jgi:hypothetical protein
MVWGYFNNLEQGQTERDRARVKEKARPATRPSVVFALFPPGGNRDSAVGARQVFSDSHLCEIGRSL